MTEPKEKSFFRTVRGAVIRCRVEWLGGEVLLTLTGGTHPHVGSVVMSEPRPSLTGEGLSATSSVINRIGHKDEAVAREAAERLAARLNTPVCAVCGIHYDTAHGALLTEILEACRSLTDEALDWLLNENLKRNTHEG